MNHLYPYNAREIAYLAIRNFWTDGTFVSDFLEKWEKEASPASQDFRLAKAIAYGCVQRALSLDAIAEQCAKKGRLALKVKERAVLHIAVYQLYYLNNIPAYAAVNEAVALAKKYCHPTFCRFLNALLRNILEAKPFLSEDKDLSRYYSYPPYLIELLFNDYDRETVRDILRLGNLPAPLMYRKRSENPLCTHLVGEEEQIAEMAKSSEIYIQNATPVALMANLAKGFAPPRNILDLCCAPGGKLIAAHDLFPEAYLYGNDLSEPKVRLISENLDKYRIQATLSCGRGEDYTHDERFDLILLDVPCSNSGVLNKRPEARWRVSPRSMADLKQLQLKLLENAVRLLSPGGQIWFMTCSILSSENEAITREASQRFCLNIEKSLTFIPNEQGWDGGFGCALSTQCG